MAIFDRIPADQLGTTFTHRGWFCGLVPVYIGNLESEAPLLVERNGIPEWWHSFVEALFGTFVFVATMLAPDYEPMYPIIVTGLIAPPDTAERGL